MGRLISSAFHAEMFVAFQLTATTAAECHILSLLKPNSSQPFRVRLAAAAALKLLHIRVGHCRRVRMRALDGVDRLLRLDRL
jgi:hypothetical protein